MTRPKASIILIKMISSHQPENGKILKSTALPVYWNNLNPIRIWHGLKRRKVTSFLTSWTTFTLCTAFLFPIRV